MKSILKMVDLKKSEEVKTLLEIDNDIIYDIKSIKSQVMILTAKNIYMCNMVAGSIRQLDITDKNISNISIDKSGIAYIYKEMSNDENTIEILNSRFKNIGINKNNNGVKEFIYYNSLVYAVQNKEINIYNRWGMHIKRYKSESVITKPIVFNDGKNIAIVYSNKIVILGI